MRNRLTLYISVALSTLVVSTYALALEPATNHYRNQIIHFYNLNSIKNLSLLPIKGYQQTEDYTCGPAAIMALMHYYGMLKDSQMNKATELKIAKEMGTNPQIGTTPQQMVTWLKSHGFKVTQGENGTIEMLQNNLKLGIPTLVEWIDWGGHWVNVAGYHAKGKNYHEDKDTIFFADPSAHFANTKSIYGLTTINPDRFNAMWFDAQLFNPGHIVKGIYIIAVPAK